MGWELLITFLYTCELPVAPESGGLPKVCARNVGAVFVFPRWADLDVCPLPTNLIVLCTRNHLDEHFDSYIDRIDMFVMILILITCCYCCCCWCYWVRIYSWNSTFTQCHGYEIVICYVTGTLNTNKRENQVYNVWKLRNYTALLVIKHEFI